MCFTLVPASALESPGNKNDLPTVTVINSETRDVTTIVTTPTSIDVRTRSSDTTIDIGYSAFVPISLPENRTIITGGKEEAGVNISIHVVYTISSNKGQIKVTRFYGEWSPDSDLYIVSNRQVGVHNGLGGDDILKRTPTSNSFDYTTGWGYVNFVYGEASPYAWADAVIGVVGMTATHSLTLGFSFPD